jgi:hypothetical protein
MFNARHVIELLTTKKFADSHFPQNNSPIVDADMVEQIIENLRNALTS